MIVGVRVAVGGIVGVLAGKMAENQRGLLDLLKIEDGKDAVEDLIRTSPNSTAKYNRVS